MKFVLLALLVVSNLYAQNNIFRDQSCKLAVHDKLFRNYPELMSTLKSILSDKDFAIYELRKDQHVPIGSLHLNFTKKMVGGGLYPGCKVDIKIKRAEHTYLSKSDKIIFELNATRSFPRVTFEGTSRCKKAIRDALYALPYCRGPQ